MHFKLIFGPLIFWFKTIGNTVALSSQLRDSGCLLVDKPFFGVYWFRLVYFVVGRSCLDMFRCSVGGQDASGSWSIRGEFAGENRHNVSATALLPEAIPQHEDNEKEHACTSFGIWLFKVISDLPILACPVIAVIYNCTTRTAHMFFFFQGFDSAWCLEV